MNIIFYLLSVHLLSATFNFIFRLPAINLIFSFYSKQLFPFFICFITPRFVITIPQVNLDEID